MSKRECVYLDNHTGYCMCRKRDRSKGVTCPYDRDNETKCQTFMTKEEYKDTTPDKEAR